MDWNVHPGRIAAVLVWIAIDGKLEKIRTDAAIVQQRIAFARRAISA